MQTLLGGAASTATEIAERVCARRSNRQRWAAEDADLVHPYLEDPTTIFRYKTDDNEEVWVTTVTRPAPYENKGWVHTNWLQDLAG